MASKLIGRTLCPECGYEKAHVKVVSDPVTGEPLEGKRHYRHCPNGDCGCQFFPRNTAQEKALLEKTRLEGTNEPVLKKAEEIPVDTELKKADPAPAPGPAPEQKYKVVLGVRVPI